MRYYSVHNKYFRLWDDAVQYRKSFRLNIPAVKSHKTYNPILIIILMIKGEA